MANRFEMSVDFVHDEMTNHPGPTLSFILEDLADLVMQGFFPSKWQNLRDANGQVVGKWRIKEEDDEQGD